MEKRQIHIQSVWWQASEKRTSEIPDVIASNQWMYVIGGKKNCWHRNAWVWSVPLRVHVHHILFVIFRSLSIFISTRTKIEFHSCMYREDFHFASGKITFDDVWYCEQVQKNERRTCERKSDSNGSSDLFDGYLIKWTCCLSAFLFVDLFQSHSLTDYPNHQRNN